MIPAAVAAANTTAGGATQAQGGVSQDLNALLGLVEADGFDPSALALSRGLRGTLRGARDTTGQNPVDLAAGNYEGIPISRAGAGVLGTAEALTGDFSMAILGMRQDMKLEISDSAVVQDEAGDIIYNAWQQDSVVGRLTFQAAYAVANLITRPEAGAGTPYPFAVLDAGLRQVDFLDDEIAAVNQLIAAEALSWPEVKRLMTVPGVNVIVAATFMAAVGDIRRFPDRRS